MQERHLNRHQYFIEQGITTEKFVIPYIEEVMPVNAQTKVLEIGCGEGGNMTPFLKRGCHTVGVDLNGPQVERAREFLKEAVPEAKINLLIQDIYEADLNALGQFDLIIMRDVIEHIHNQEKFLGFVKKLLTPKGRIFFGFPPWRMPFGGHQQVCHSKVLSKLPFFHILPVPVYKGVLKIFGENEHTTEALLEIKETGISINRFERIVEKENYIYDKKTLYFINPNYKTKFGLTPRKLSSLISWMPHIRDSFTTCYYCIIRRGDE